MRHLILPLIIAKDVMLYRGLFVRGSDVYWSARLRIKAARLSFMKFLESVGLWTGKNSGKILGHDQSLEFFYGDTIRPASAEVCNAFPRVAPIMCLLFGCEARRFQDVMNSCEMLLHCGD